MLHLARRARTTRSARSARAAARPAVAAAGVSSVAADAGRVRPPARGPSAWPGVSEKGVAANEAECERPPPSRRHWRGRWRRARRRAAGGRAAARRESSRVVGVVHKLLVLLGGREDLDEASIVRLQLRFASSRWASPRRAWCAARSCSSTRGAGARARRCALELGGARAPPRAPVRRRGATSASGRAPRAPRAIRLLQLDRRLLCLRQPVDAALLRAERRLQLRTSRPSAARPSPAAPRPRGSCCAAARAARRERLRLAKPAAQFLDRRRERGALLARARELQLGEAQLVAKLRAAAPASGQRALVCVVALHLLLRALGGSDFVPW